MRTRLAVSLLVLSAFFPPTLALAQWQPNGVAISTAGVDQWPPVIASDGAGGAIMAWQDNSTGAFDIYARKVNAAGVPQWTVNGVLLCNATGDQVNCAIVSDGAGGAIVAWQDPRVDNGDIYAQRVNASGVAQWTANGVGICTAIFAQSYPTITSDGAGGAIVTWQDGRTGVWSIYAQRINASGVVQWTANGVVLCTNLDTHTPAIASDGANGAIITWQDGRGGTNYDIYAQRINASGVVQWTANGVPVSVAANVQFPPKIVSDGVGGAIMTWYDGRSGPYDIYAQRINASGLTQWAVNGLAICTAAQYQLYPTLVSDGAGGAIVTWGDNRSLSYDIYAQRVSALGSVQWAANGVAICAAPSDQAYPAIASDGAGGAVLTWHDNRSVTNYHIYAQRVNNSGVVQWTTDGVALCTAANDQSFPAIVADGTGGAIAAWQDNRSGTADAYAQRVEFRYGYWGHPEPVITSVADIPGDQGGKVKVNWTASNWDVLNLRTITYYSVWRAVDAAALQSGQAAAAIVASPSHVSADFRGKAYWVQHAPQADYYWEWVGNQDARYLPTYSFSAATRADSTSQGSAQHDFMVFSQTADDFTFWPSNVVSGHSVDNLAPAAPLYLTAQRIGNYVYLKWNRVHVPDLKDYAVYRATSSGVTPVPANFLSNANDSVLTDTNAPVSVLHYIVTALDVHQNQSAPSNEATVSAATGVGNTPSITQLTVLANHPNPFTGSTELEIGLPSASDITVEIYDVAGRRVSEISIKQANAGWQRIPFTGHDTGGHALASGVYFYRVHAAGMTVTRKMVIAR